MDLKDGGFLLILGLLYFCFWGRVFFSNPGEMESGKAKTLDRITGKTDYKKVRSRAKI